MKGRAVAADLYLGYGPVKNQGGGTTLKNNAAIQAGESAIFSIAFPSESRELMDQALGWMNRFGTLGGRSRNGWGSLHLQPEEDTPFLQASLPLRPWEQALQLDWPHAIGKDEKGPLIWQTRAFDNWRGVMEELARIKIDLRTRFRFTKGNNAPLAEEHHWLSYPVTNHSVQHWGHSARLPNSLRFKVHARADGQLVGEIFHMPCKPPAAFGPDHKTLVEVWEKAHDFLDQRASLTRVRA